LSRRRGRPRGQRQSAPDMARLWYLFYVSKEYGLEPHSFFKCIFDAWMHERSSYKGIVIQCRQKTEDDGVFLVTRDQKVITQLRLTTATLTHLPEIDLEGSPWDEYIALNKLGKAVPVDMKIKDVNLGVKWVNLKARIVEKPVARTVFSRYGHNPLGISNSTISDDTGSIRLSLWNNQIDMVSLGDTVRIENGRVRTFRGELQVSVGRSGKLTVIATNQNKHSTR